MYRGGAGGAGGPQHEDAEGPRLVRPGHRLAEADLSTIAGMKWRKVKDTIRANIIETVYQVDGKHTMFSIKGDNPGHKTKKVKKEKKDTTKGRRRSKYNTITRGGDPRKERLEVEKSLSLILKT